MGYQVDRLVFTTKRAEFGGQDLNLESTLSATSILTMMELTNFVLECKVGSFKSEMTRLEK